MYDLVMLLGGTGSRMMDKPEGNKHLVEVAGKPVIEYLKNKIDRYERAVEPFKNKYIITNGQGVEQIMKTFGQGYKYLFQEKPTGVPDAIKLANPKMPFFVQLGDQFYEEEIGAFIQGFLESDKYAKVWLKDSPEASKHTTAFFSEDNWIKKFVEKPQGLPNGFVCTGMYMLKPTALQYINDLPRGQKGENNMADLMTRIQAEHGYQAVGYKMMNGFWGDINTRERVDYAQRSLR